MRLARRSSLLALALPTLALASVFSLSCASPPPEPASPQAAATPKVAPSSTPAAEPPLVAWPDAETDPVSAGCQLSFLAVFVLIWGVAMWLARVSATVSCRRAREQTWIMDGLPESPPSYKAALPR